MKALPKIHKQNIPIRPVINCINSPNYKVSKFITKILKEKINLKNKFTAKNSLKLANKLKGIKITEETKMASFDIKKSIHKHTNQRKFRNNQNTSTKRNLKRNIQLSSSK